MQSNTGRPISELMHIFTTHLENSPSDYINVSETVSVSELNRMSLDEYIQVSIEYCRTRHTDSCKRCLPLVIAAKLVKDRGICPLSHIYRQVFLFTKYNNRAAKRKLLQIPVAAIRCGSPESGTSRTFLMEILPGCDHIYQKIIDFYLESVQWASETATPAMTKDHLRQLLTLAQSDRERECIKYAVYKSSGLTPSAARRLYGFEEMSRREKWLKKLLSKRYTSVKVLIC